MERTRAKSDNACMLRDVRTAILALVLVCVGCSRAAHDETPEGVVRLFLDKMEVATDDEPATREVFGLLGPTARANLEERARRASLTEGRRVDPADMLAPGRFGLKFRPRAMKTSIVGDRATVEVMGGEPGERASVRLVREGEAWRIEPEFPEVGVRTKRDGG